MVKSHASYTLWFIFNADFHCALSHFADHLSQVQYMTVFRILFCLFVFFVISTQFFFLRKLKMRIKTGGWKCTYCQLNQTTKTQMQINSSLTLSEQYLRIFSSNHHVAHSYKEILKIRSQVSSFTLNQLVSCWPVMFNANAHSGAYFSAPTEEYCIHSTTHSVLTHSLRCWRQRFRVSRFIKIKFKKKIRPPKPQNQGGKQASWSQSEARLTYRTELYTVYAKKALTYRDYQAPLTHLAKIPSHISKWLELSCYVHLPHWNKTLWHGPIQYSSFVFLNN